MRSDINNIPIRSLHSGKRKYDRAMEPIEPEDLFMDEEDETVL
jgi:hypothetical protein